MGSAYSWLKNDDVSCDHTIPAEIAQKIVEKIHSGERYVAYVVIPMFPEGDPSGYLVQEQLYWQARTMEMMYSRIAEAIRETGNGTHPTGKYNFNVEKIAYLINNVFKFRKMQ